jgi:hypothetical protein
MYLGAHVETVPASDPAHNYQPDEHGNNCQQRRFYLEDHIAGQRPWSCSLPWATDLRCTDGFYSDQFESIMQAANMGPANCAGMDKRWDRFKLGLGLSGLAGLAVAGLVVYKILD